MGKIHLEHNKQYGFGTEYKCLKEWIKDSRCNVSYPTLRKIYNKLLKPGEIVNYKEDQTLDTKENSQ